MAWSQGVFFGQLLGMADQLTFPLGRSGYRVRVMLASLPCCQLICFEACVCSLEGREKVCFRWHLKAFA